MNKAKQLPKEVRDFCKLIKKLSKKKSSAIAINHQTMQILAKKRDFQKAVLLFRQRHNVAVNGFRTSEEYEQWQVSMPDRRACNKQFDEEIIILTEAFGMADDFVKAVEHFVLTGEIGRIKGNVTLVVDIAAGKKVSSKKHQAITKDEGVWERQVSNGLLSIIKPGRPQRFKRSLERDLKEFRANERPIDDSENLPTRDADTREKTRRKVSSHRMRKRVG